MFFWVLFIMCDARCLGRTILPPVSPRFAYLDSSRSEFAPPVSVFVCLFLCYFVWFTSLSLSFIHSDYALTNLPSNFGELQLWLHPTFIRPFFFKNAGWFLFPHQRLIAPRGLTRNRPRWDLQKFPMKEWSGGKASFFLNELLGPFFAVFKSWWWFFFVDCVHQFGMVKRLHLIFLRFFFGGWCVTEFQKQQVPCIDCTTIFTQTYLLKFW